MGDNLNIVMITSTDENKLSVQKTPELDRNNKE